MRDRIWPAAPRPFPDEAFGGWFGRVAGRYGITVDELATAAGIELDLNPGGSGWLATNAPAKKSMQELAGLCRLAPEEVDGLCRPTLVGSGWLVYCYHCLVLNPCDVFSPYWRQAWIGSSGPPSLSVVNIASPDQTHVHSCNARVRGRRRTTSLLVFKY